MKFEIGHKYNLFEDDVYIITRMSNDLIFLELLNIKGIPLAYSEHDFIKFFGYLKRIKDKCKNTRLARKLYPDAEVSECGEWIYV